MICKRWILTSVLALALAFAGCGDKGGGGESGSGAGGPAGGSEAAPKATPVPGELAALVPTNTMALVYVKSPAELEGKAIQLMSRIDPKMASEIQLEPMVGQMLRGAVEHWDSSKPMAIAVPLPGPDQEMEEAFEGVAMIFGMKDANAAKAAMEAAFEKQMEGVPEKYRPKPEDRPQFVVSGNYITMTRGKGGPRGGAAIAATAPDGDIALRIDLAAIIQRFRKDIDKGLAEMQDSMSGGLEQLPPSARSLGGMFEGIADFAKDFVDSAETLDISMSMDGGSVELAFGFVAKQGSAFDKPGHDHAGLAALAAHLPAEFPVNILMSMDMGSMMEWMKPLMETAMEQMPEEQRAKFETYLAETTEMSKLLGPNMAVGLTMGDQGLQMVEIAQSKDPATYIQRADKLFSGDALAGIAGFTAKKAGGTTVAGVNVSTYEMSFDLKAMMESQGTADQMPPEMLDQMNGFMKTMFGGEKLRMHMAPLGDKLLFTMGSPERMATLIESVRKGGTTPPKTLAGPLGKAGGTPTFFLHVDVRALAKQIVPIVGEMMDDAVPTVPEGGAIPIVVWGKHDGRVYGGGLQVDVGGIVEMVQAMEEK